MKRVMKSESEMGEFAEKFAYEILPQVKKNTGAAVVGLSGDLGSGKTTFVKYLARTLGVGETVSSPTFVIEKIYKLPDGNDFTHLVHIDAYRLEGEGEFLALGWNNLLASPSNLILIEWPEKVANALPKNTTFIQFTFIDENTREVEY